MRKKKTQKFWTQEEDQILINEYLNCDIDEMCQRLNRTKPSICGRAMKFKLKRNKITKKLKYPINYNYFKKIDNKTKAYWYGFIWGDGYVSKNYGFSLVLQERDKYLIEKFQKNIGSGYPMKKHRIYKTWGICLTNKQLVQSLNQLNVVNRKSYSNLKPILEDCFFLDFLHGLFDADGTLTKYHIVITNTLQTNQWIQEKLKTLFNIDSKIYSIKGHPYTFRLCINKKIHSLYLQILMYERNNFCLKRKKNKFLKFKKEFEFQHCGGRKIKGEHLEKFLSLPSMNKGREHFQLQCL